jgi:hypothetical protein
MFVIGSAVSAYSARRKPNEVGQQVWRNAAPTQQANSTCLCHQGFALCAMLVASLSAAAAAAAAAATAAAATAAAAVLAGV